MDSQTPPRDAVTLIQLLLGRLSLTTPPSAFTIFSKLPTELRLNIFEHALPIGTKGRRFLQAKARIGAPSRSQKPAWFVLEDNACSSDVKDVGLLRANKESRDVYLRYFNKSLRTKGQGLIRYHENDIIYISNVDTLLAHPLISAEAQSGDRFQHLLDSCTNFAIPCSFFLFYTKLTSNTSRGGLKNVSQFKQLKALSAVLDWEFKPLFPHLTEQQKNTLRENWWCYISHLEQKLIEWTAEERISAIDKNVELLLIGVDGEVMEGKKCTVEKCLTEKEGMGPLI